MLKLVNFYPYVSLVAVVSAGVGAIVMFCAGAIKTAKAFLYLRIWS